MGKRTKPTDLSAGAPAHPAGRGEAEDALRERVARPAAGLGPLERLHAVSARLIRQDNPVLLLEDILEAALGISGADCGTLQMVDPASGTLRIASHRGLERPFLDLFGSVTPETPTSSARAWTGRERVLVEDVEQSAVFGKGDTLEAMLEAGIRSTAATPLISRDGRVTGVMSTHWRAPHRPDARVLRLLDLLARQAADAIERARSEEALRESEKRFRGLFDQSPLGAALIAPDLRYLKVNKGYSDVTGYSAEELASLTFPEFTHPDDVEADFLDVKALIEGKVNHYEKEKRYIRKGGDVVWVRVSIRGILTDEGRLRYFLSLVEDITPRKRMEEALASALQRLAAHMDNSPLAVVEFGPDFRVIRWSSEAERLFGWSREEMAGRAIGEIRWVHEGDAEAVREVAEAMLRGQRARNRQVNRNYRKDGSVVLCEWYNSAIYDADGRLESVLSQVLDVTERQRAEAALLQGMNRLDLLAATAGELLRASMPQEVVESLCRRVMAQLDCHLFFNFLVDEKAGRLRLNAWAGIPDEEARRIEWLEYGVSVCGCSARDGNRIVAERIPTTPDERTEMLKSYGVKACACHPLSGPGGKILGTLLFGTRGRETFSEDDLSLMKAVADHVAMAMTRMKNEEALRESLAEKDDLLRELSHRTKNNMQVIVGLLALQAAKAEDAHLSGALESAQDRIRAMALVHEKLYQSGSVSTLDMREYLKDLVGSLLKAHQGARGAVKPVLDLEEIVLSLDEALPCGLIVNELVSNSLKHAFKERRAGSIRLSLRRAGGRVELRYGDDGPGLPKGLELSKARSLGLKLVYNLAVRQLRGTMELVREPQAEFRFLFPPR